MEKIDLKPDFSRQVESVILRIPFDKCLELYMHPKLDFSRLLPSLVKKSTIVRGQGHTEGSVVRLDRMDGTFCEFEVTKMDKK
jgi:hypothetical protein